MDALNGTGITYPKLTIAGVEYELKFSRAALKYRVAKHNLNASDLTSPNNMKRLAATYDFLHAMLIGQFTGSVEDLVEAMEPGGNDLVRAASIAVNEALVKVFPPTQTPAPVAAGEAAPKLN